MWNAIEKGISDAIGRAFRIDSRQGVGGGCINEAFRIAGGEQAFFVKLNDAARIDMFEAEAAGLAAIRASDSLRAPDPIALGVTGSCSWLVMEYIPFASPRASTSTLLGEQLAAMHRCEARQFGWERDNTIGATPQPNRWHDDWIRFWRDQRLGYQLAMAAENGAPARLVHSGGQLLETFSNYFSDYRPVASLLHGDLWGGNWAADGAGTPVIFDPAVYFGDREADLAMTELFGGFDREFYAAYQGEWPLDPGYGSRKTLYNLYHVLNHFNLFGGGYASQAQEMVNRLLAGLSG